MSSPTVRPLLELRGLRYTYPDGREALHGIDLAIAAGERLAVLGPNGAGKSTLALHLNGILTPTSGDMLIDGEPIERRNVHEVRRRVGVVFQDPDDQLFMPTVREDIAFGPSNFGVTGDELDLRVEEALQAVGLSDAADMPPHHLSYGQRCRAALAAVLAMRPDVLVLDEPSANLDPASRRALADTLMALDVTIVMVTHDLLYALQLCPRSVLLSDGRVVADRPTAELLSDSELIHAHRLELPFGLNPALLGANPTDERPACLPS